MKHLKHIVLWLLISSMLVMSLTACSTSSNTPDEGNSTQNESTHEHNFVDGKCECGEKDPNYVPPHEHSFVEGKCECGEKDPNYVPPHEHSFVEGKCECGEEDPNYAPPHKHNFVEGKCECGEKDPNYAPSHKHSFVEGKCECGEKDPNYVPPHEHSFVEGKCECGEKDPNYVPPHEHVFVEGKCECGEEDPNYVPPHEHVFVEGKCECGEEDPNYVPPHNHVFIDGKCECGEAYVATDAEEWTLVTELKDGDLVLIGAPAYGKLLSAEKVNASSFYNKGVDYSANDFSNVTDAETFVVTVNADGTYTFTSLTGDVIALAASYSSLNKDGEHKSWSLVDKGNGLFLVKNTGRNTYLEWYSSKDNWSTYTAGNTDEYELSFYAKKASYDESHVHNHISDVHATTCTTDGYTTYTCVCGDSYTVDGKPATGHTYVEGKCACGAEDPEYHVHDYKPVVTTPATCSSTGVEVPTCSCGDTKEPVEIPISDHIDANLDITCDFDGCTKRILPAANSTISLFTARHMIIVSLSSSYYMEGVVTQITNAQSGIFVITDDAGDSIIVRLPKDADGNAYANWKANKVTLGDTIRVYGKPSRNTDSTTSATYAAKVEGGILTVVKHEHSFSDPTCTVDGTCGCLAIGTPALGHTDANGDDSCDRCQWNMKLSVTNIAVSTDGTTNGVLATDKTSWTWSKDEFDVVIAKGTSTFTLYTTAKAYMQLKKLNTLTVSSKNDASIYSVTIGTTNATQLNNLKKAIGTAYEYTEDESTFSVTIVWNSKEDFVLVNNGTSTVYVNKVEITYE